MAVESIPWNYQDSTSMSNRKHGCNSDKTLSVTALSFTKLKRILLSQPSRNIQRVMALFRHMVAARVYYTADLLQTHKEVGVGETERI